MSPVEELLEIEELRLNNLDKYIGSADDQSIEGQRKAYSFLARFATSRCRLRMFMVISALDLLQTKGNVGATPAP